MKKLLIIVVILLISTSLFAKSHEWITFDKSNKNEIEVEVISSNEFAIEIQYSLNRFKKTPVEIENKKFFLLNIPSESKFLKKGYPSLPRINRSIMIPKKAKMEAKIVDFEVVEYKDIPIAPSKGNLLRSVDPSTIPYSFSEFYSKNAWFPEKIVFTRKPYILRKARGMVVELHPFQYNPKKNVLRVYKNVKIRIENIGVSNVNTLENDFIDKGSVQKDFLNIYKTRFINFPDPQDNKYDLVEEVGSMLIITADQYYDAILPLVQWKIQKGIPTTVKKISEIGGNNQTNIQNEIQNAYTNNNMAFVLLVGDADDVTPHSIKKDPLYVLLEGGDHYPDAFISRFCAISPVDIENQVNKSIKYEKEVATYGGDWYHEGTGIASSGGPGDDGEYDYEHLRNIRTQLLNYNYTFIDELYDGSQGGGDAPGNPTPTMVLTAINSGRSLVNYTGHGGPTGWSTSGFSNSDVDLLTNGYELPLVVSVACWTGQFYNTECFGEHWLKAGTTDNPAGAIGFYGSTISQSWDPPMEMQDEEANLITQEEALTLGGICFNGSCSMMDDYGYSGQTEYDCWTLFGDASIQLKTDNAEAITVFHDDMIPLGATTYDVEVENVEDALVALSMNDTLYGYGYTDDTGNVTINLIEDLVNPGTMHLTVTAYNKIPYITTIEALVPVQVTISPDEINVNQSTDVTVTVMSFNGIIPEVGVNVWAEGLDYETVPVPTDDNGEAILSLNYQFGPSLNIIGKRPDESYILFEEQIDVIANSLTNPDLVVTTNIALNDTFGLNFSGTIHQYCGNNETTLWVKLNNNDFINTTEDTLSLTPDELGNVTAIISKSGYNLYQEIFPVIDAYGTVSGIVTNMGTGEPVANAEVKFYQQGVSPPEDPIFTAITNSLGEYEVEDDYPVNHYDIYINKWGFNPYVELNYFLCYGNNIHDIEMSLVESGNITGQLYSIFFPLSEGTLTYYRSDNGEEYASVSLSNYQYSVDLPCFSYNVYVSSSGFVPYYGTLNVQGDMEINYHLGNAALYTDLEDNDGEFVSNNPNGWQWGKPTAGGINAYSGINVWGTVLGGVYANYANWTLDSPEFTIPNDAELTFYHYYDFEGGYTLYDGGNVKISTDGGTSYQLIIPEEGYDGNISALNEPGFGGSITDWEKVTFNLSTFVGEDAILRWHFASDSYVNNYYGWYIDNILVGDQSSSYQEIISSNNESLRTQKLILQQNFPNPVDHSTTIKFSIPKNTKTISLKIYNVLGQLVKTYKPNTKDITPSMEFIWDTKDEFGKPVTSGIYFYKISTDNKELVKKMTVIR